MHKKKWGFCWGRVVGRHFPDLNMTLEHKISNILDTSNSNGHPAKCPVVEDVVPNGVLSQFHFNFPISIPNPSFRIKSHSIHSPPHHLHSFQAQNAFRWTLLKSNLVMKTRVWQGFFKSFWKKDFFAPQFSSIFNQNENKMSEDIRERVMQCSSVQSSILRYVWILIFISGHMCMHTMLAWRT